MEKTILGFKKGTKGFAALIDFKSKSGFDVDVKKNCCDENVYYVHGFASTKSNTPFEAIRKFDPTLKIKHVN